MCRGGNGSSVLQVNPLSGSNSSGVGSYHLLLPTSAAGAATATGLTAVHPSTGTTGAVVLSTTGTSGTISAATRASLIHTLTL